MVLDILYGLIVGSAIVRRIHEAGPDSKKAADSAAAFAANMLGAI